MKDTLKDKDALLFGRDTTKGMVGLVEYDDTRVKCFYADGTDSLHTVMPSVWTTKEKASAIPKSAYKRIDELSGTGERDRLVIFDSVDSWRKSKNDLGGFTFHDVKTHFLLQSGKTFFKGMAPNDIHRMQIDIEAYNKTQFPRAEKDPIFIVSMCDNRDWERVIYYRPEGPVPGLDRRYVHFFTETEMLEALVIDIHRRNPDVLELHNGLAFDLPYIQKRCEILGVNFAIGRDSKVPKTRPAKKAFAERDVEYTHYDVGGRSVVDTLFLAIDWDVYARKLSGYGLKQVAKVLKCAPPDRVYIDGDKIAETWDNDPKTVLEYALHDVYETRAIAAKIMPAFFALAQMMPVPYQDTYLRGKSAVIQTLFVREYLRQRVALPVPEEGRQKFGGHVELRQTGVFDDVLYLDVASLYPAIMLNYEIQPESETLGLFPVLLLELTEQRLAAKALMNELEPGTPEYEILDAKQSALKIIINSFYGMVGAGGKVLFCDISEADRVALTGQQLLKRLMSLIEAGGCSIIECDTDGVLAVQPKTGLGSTPDTHRAFVQSISDQMPEGINVDFDGYYPKMISKAKKNYALMERDGSIKMKGGGFKSRGLEPIFRRYFKDIIKPMFDRDVPAIGKVHTRYKRMIENGAFTLDEIAKSAVLKTSLAAYKKKRDAGDTNPAAQYEIGLKLAEAGRDIQPGMRMKWVIQDTPEMSMNKSGVVTIKSIPKSRVRAFADAVNLDDAEWEKIHIEFLLSRLQTVATRFDVFFTKEDFAVVFSKEISGLDDPARCDGITIQNVQTK